MVVSRNVSLMKKIKALKNIQFLFVDVHDAPQHPYSYNGGDGISLLGFLRGIRSGHDHAWGNPGPGKQGHYVLLKFG